MMKMENVACAACEMMTVDGCAAFVEVGVKNIWKRMKNQRKKDRKREDAS